MILTTNTLTKHYHRLLHMSLLDISSINRFSILPFKDCVEINRYLEKNNILNLSNEKH